MTNYTQPMLLTDAEAFPADVGKWQCEVKWNGMRTIIHTDAAGTARYVSRTGTVVTDQFPELHVALPALCTFDAEIVCGDDNTRGGTTDLLRRLRMRMPEKIRSAVNATPADLMIFDVLRVAGVDVTGEPLAGRRRRLTLALGNPEERWGCRVHRSQTWPGVAASAVFDATAEQHLEGIVLKRLTSPYRVGVRSPDWQRMKHAAE